MIHFHCRKRWTFRRSSSDNSSWSRRTSRCLKLIHFQCCTWLLSFFFNLSVSLLVFRFEKLWWCESQKLAVVFPGLLKFATSRTSIREFYILSFDWCIKWCVDRDRIQFPLENMETLNYPMRTYVLRDLKRYFAVTSKISLFPLQYSVQRRNKYANLNAKTGTSYYWVLMYGPVRRTVNGSHVSSYLPTAIQCDDK